MNRKARMVPRAVALLLAMVVVGALAGCAGSGSTSSAPASPAGAPRSQVDASAGTIAAGATTISVAADAAQTCSACAGTGATPAVKRNATRTTSSATHKTASKAPAKPKPKPKPSLQSIAFNNKSGVHQTLTARAKTPINITFDPSATGCAAKIHFTTGTFVQTNAVGHNVSYHSDGLPAGTYSWKCSMDDCCYGTLIVK